MNITNLARIEKLEKYIKAQSLFNAIQHEVVGNGAFNWIVEVDNKYPAHFSDLDGTLDDVFDKAEKYDGLEL